MPISDILALITGVLQFPQAVLSVIKALRASPAEHQQKIVDAIQKEMANISSGGRPSWD